MSLITDGDFFDLSSIYPTPWEKFFAWAPVKVNNRIYWLKYLYRRQILRTEVITLGDGRETTSVKTTRNVTQYGTIFDVLKGESK